MKLFQFTEDGDKVRAVVNPFGKTYDVRIFMNIAHTSDYERDLLNNIYAAQVLPMPIEVSKCLLFFSGEWELKIQNSIEILYKLWHIVGPIRDNVLELPKDADLESASAEFYRCMAKNETELLAKREKLFYSVPPNPSIDDWKEAASRFEFILSEYTVKVINMLEGFIWDTLVPKNMRERVPRTRFLTRHTPELTIDRIHAKETFFKISTRFYQSKAEVYRALMQNAEAHEQDDTDYFTGPYPTEGDNMVKGYISFTLLRDYMRFLDDKGHLPRE